MTTQPLCDVGYRTEKRRIKELTMIEQTEKKSPWGWNSHQPLRCTGQSSPALPIPEA